MKRRERCSRGAALACACALVAASCSPGGDDVSSQTYLIYTLEEESRDYRLQRSTISTLQDVRTVDGEVVFMRGGGQLATPEPDPQTREEWLNVLDVRGSEEPTVEYTVDDDGTVVPWDFDSAMMLTVYHHFERAAAYFGGLTEDRPELREQLGDDIDELVGRVPCHYYPTVGVLGIPIPIFVDNAAYAPTMNAFLVPPRRQLDDAVPIYANRGVITHEYSHAVFNRLVHNGDKVPDPFLENWAQTATRAENELSGLDEGVADIFGALDTGDPDFIGASISGELIDRDMEKVRYYEECLSLAVQNGVYPNASACGGDYGANVDIPVDSRGVRFDHSAGQPFAPHHLGGVVAATIWALRDRHSDVISDGELGLIVALSLRDIQEPTQDFRLAHFFDAFHQHLPPSVQGQACALFKERLIVISDELQCQP